MRMAGLSQGMIGLITESVETLLNSWKSKIEAEGGIADIRIDEHMRSFSGDVISRACFGSSYARGKEIFLRLRALQEAMSKKIFSVIPGMRYPQLEIFMTTKIIFFSPSTDPFCEMLQVYSNQTQQECLGAGEGSPEFNSKGGEREKAVGLP